MNFNFGVPKTTATAASTTTPLANTTTSAAAPTMNLFSNTPTTKSAFSLTPQTTSTISPITPKTDGNKTTFNIPGTAANTTSTGFTLPTSTPSTTSATTTLPSTSISLTTSTPSTTATSAASIPPPASMTYSQVEDLLNKWTNELAEQERLFFTQVTQVNAWDKLLADNCSKLMKLHSTIEKVQEHQKKINLDLDFILSQKKELENALQPLEKEYSSSSYHPDVQREKMYHTAENIDAQIKKMSEDVKETIEHVNETSHSQENMHPIVQIGKVLNAQMNSLQWIDENSAQLQSQIESMSRYLDNIKRETERAYIPFQ